MRSRKKMRRNIEIHKHTHTDKPKHTNNKETDRCLSERSVFDRCLTGTIGAHGSCLIGASGSRLIGAHGYGSCLIGARQIGACGSELGRSVLVDRSLIGAVDRCSCGSELWIGAFDRSLWPRGREMGGSVLLTGACDRKGDRWLDRCFWPELVTERETDGWIGASDRSLWPRGRQIDRRDGYTERKTERERDGCRERERATIR